MKTKINQNQITVPLFFALFIVLICSPNVHAQETKPLTRTKIGVLLPLTGPFARYGEKIRRSIESLDNNGTQFIFEDEGCDPKIALNAYRKLTQFDQVKIFLGPWCGSPQSAIAPLLKSHEQFALLGSSSPISLFDLSAGLMYSTQPSIEAESTFMAKQVLARGADNVVIVYRENAFSQAHAQVFAEHFLGKILDTLTYVSDDLSSLKSIAIRIKQLKPRALYVPDAYPILGGLLKELAAIGLSKLPVYSVYSIQSEDVLLAIGSHAGSLIYSYPETSGKDALEYFPMRAAELLSLATRSCGDKTDCIQITLRSSANFDNYGILTGKLILKTIHNRTFVPLTPALN